MDYKFLDDNFSHARLGIFGMIENKWFVKKSRGFNKILFSNEPTFKSRRKCLVNQEN